MYAKLRQVVSYQSCCCDLLWHVYIIWDAYDASSDRKCVSHEKLGIWFAIGEWQ